jgi:hypothetical protein
MKYTAAAVFGLCLVTSAAHAQGWITALTGLGAFSQGVQNGEAQRYNMQHGYPAQTYQPSYGAQYPQNYIPNGRTVTCQPFGSYIYCQ